jgi:hypothetical protein
VPRVSGAAWSLFRALTLRTSMNMREQLKWYDALDDCRAMLFMEPDEEAFYTLWFLEMCKGWSIGELLVKEKATSRESDRKL